MRRTAFLLAAVLLGAAAPRPHAAAQPKQPPHAWLFGTWTGGIFPAPENMTREACFSQPVVIFTRDLVLRATLFDQTLDQRVIETVRTTSKGAEFRFASAARGGSLLTPGIPQQTGFGCDSPDQLNVQRRGRERDQLSRMRRLPQPARALQIACPCASP